MTIRTVVAQGVEFGQVYRKSWCWHWDETAVTYPRELTLEDVRADIAKQLGVSQRDVSLRESA